MKKPKVYKTLFYNTNKGCEELEKAMNELYENGYRYIGSIRFTLIFELIPT